MIYKLIDTQTRTSPDIKWYGQNFPEKRIELNNYRETNFPEITKREWVKNIPLSTTNPRVKVFQYISNSREKLESFVAFLNDPDPSTPFYEKKVYDSENNISTSLVIEEEIIE